VCVPSLDHFHQLSVPLADFWFKILVVAQLLLELVKLTNSFLELDLLGEDTLTEGTGLLQLLLLVIEEDLEVGLHVADWWHARGEGVRHC